jgi:hypothetical protein
MYTLRMVCLAVQPSRVGPRGSGRACKSRRAGVSTTSASDACTVQPAASALATEVSAWAKKGLRSEMAGRITAIQQLRKAPHGCIKRDRHVLACMLSGVG